MKNPTFLRYSKAVVIALFLVLGTSFTPSAQAFSAGSFSDGVSSGLTQFRGVVVSVWTALIQNVLPSAYGYIDRGWGAYSEISRTALASSSDVLMTVSERLPRGVLFAEGVVVDVFADGVEISAQTTADSILASARVMTDVHKDVVGIFTTGAYLTVSSTWETTQTLFDITTAVAGIFTTGAEATFASMFDVVRTGADINADVAHIFTTGAEGVIAALMDTVSTGAHTVIDINAHVTTIYTTGAYLTFSSALETTQTLFDITKTVAGIYTDGAEKVIALSIGGVDSVVDTTHTLARTTNTVFKKSLATATESFNIPTASVVTSPSPTLLQRMRTTFRSWLGITDAPQTVINLPSVTAPAGETTNTIVQSPGQVIETRTITNTVAGITFLDITNAIAGLRTELLPKIKIAARSPETNFSISDDVLTIADGPNGYILQSTGSDIAWVATSSLGITSGSTDGLTLTDWYATTTDGLDEGIVNRYYTDPQVQTYLDTLSKGFFFATSSVDYWKTVTNFFSTTSADNFINSSSTIAAASGVTSGNVLQWNGSRWVSVATTTLGISGTTDHGLLTGLLDDDHTQYALLAGRSGGESLLGINTLSSATGQILTLSSTAPAPTVGASQAGKAVSITASNAVASTDTAGAAAGGSVTISAGAAARLTSGNANGGDINLVPGAGIGTGIAGMVVVPDGGTTALSIRGAGGTNTGISFSGAGGNWRMVTGGSQTIFGTGTETRFLTIVNFGGTDVGLDRLSAGILRVTNGGSGGGALYTDYFYATSTTATSTFAGTLSLTGRLADSSGTGGTSGMVLQTNGTGVVWVATSTLGISVAQEWTDGGAFDYNLENVYVGTSTEVVNQPLFAIGTSSALFTVSSLTGFVGIGTTSPGGSLSIKGKNGTNALLISDQDNATKIGLTVTGSAGDSVGTLKFFNNNNASYAQIYQTSGTFNVEATTGGNGLNLSGSAGTPHVRIATGGNVGIGTTSPYAKLSVVGPVVAEYFHATSTTATSTFSGGLSAADSAGLTVLQNGNVGIGTTSPQAALHIQPSSGRAPLIIQSDNGFPFIVRNAAGSNLAYLESTGKLNLAGGLAAGADITASNVLLGGSSRVSSGFFTDTANTKGYWDTTASGINWLNVNSVASNVNVVIRGAGGQSVDLFQIQNNTATTLFNVTAGGKVGIGTTSPYAKLSVHAGASDGLQTLFAIATSTLTSTTTLFSVDRTGTTSISSRLGIGTVSPLSGANLEVSGSIRLNDGTDGQSIYFANANTDRFKIYQNGTVLKFASQDTTGRTFLFTGGTVDGPTGAHAAALFDITGTWNQAADTLYGLRMNITNTNSAAASKLIDLQVASASKFSVTPGGSIITGAGNNTGDGIQFGTAGTIPAFGRGDVRLLLYPSTSLSAKYMWNTTAFNVSSDMLIGFTSSTDANGALQDTALARLSAGVIGITNGAGGGGALKADYFNATSTTATSTFAGTLSLTGRLADSSGTGGTSGMVLQTNGTGVVWVATSTLNIVGAADGAFSTTSADYYINASSTIANASGITTGNVLQWDGSKWVSVATSTLGISGGPGASEWTDGGAFDYNLENVYVGTSTEVVNQPLFAIGTSSALFTVSSSTGYVGIGTASPLNKFHTSLSTGQLAFFGSDISTASGNYTGIGFGYGFTGPSYQKSALVQEQVGDNNARGTIHILNDGTADNSNATLADARLSITYAGNIGIGTSSPYAKLSLHAGASDSLQNLFVVATSTLTGTTTVFSIDRIGNLSLRAPQIDYAISATSTILNNSAFSWTLATSTSGTPIFRIDSTTGSASKATTTITGGFIVDGGAISYDYSSGVTAIQALSLGNITFDDDAGTVQWMNLPVSTSAASGTVQSYTAYMDGNPLITVYGQSTGSGTTTYNRVGIATTSPWRTFSASGTVAFNGLTVAGASGSALCLATGGEVVVNTGVQTCTVSSLRFKHDVASLIQGLDTIRVLRPTSFKYNSTGEERVGFIAEEVDLIDKRLVSYELVATTTATGETVMIQIPRSVRYEDLTSIIVKAIQELDAKVTLALAATGQAVTDAVLNIKKLIVDEEICIGTTCVNEAQLKELLEKNAIVPGATENESGSGGGGDGGTGTTTPDSGTPTSTPPLDGGGDTGTSTQPVEEPPIIEEPPIVEEPPVIEEPPVTEELPVEETPVVEEPPVSEPVL